MESIDQIVHGDSLNVLPTLPAQSVGLVVTDPPYLVRYRDRHGRSIRNGDNPQVLAVFSELSLIHGRAWRRLSRTERAAVGKLSASTVALRDR